MRCEDLDSATRTPHKSTAAPKAERSQMSWLSQVGKQLGYPTVPSIRTQPNGRDLAGQGSGIVEATMILFPIWRLCQTNSHDDGMVQQPTYILRLASYG